MANKTTTMHIAALAIAIAGVTGAAFFAHASASQEPLPMALAAVNSGDFSHHSAQIAKHLDEVGATPQQKAQVDSLLGDATADFQVLHEAARQDHDAFVNLLTQDRIDRDALEGLRLDHLQKADLASKRKLQLIADIADVLTPAQRRALAESVKQHHRGPMMHLHHDG